MLTTPIGLSYVQNVRLRPRRRLTDDLPLINGVIYIALFLSTTASYQRVMWTATARCGWRHWSVASLSVSLCRRRRRKF